MKVISPAFLLNLNQIKMKRFLSGLISVFFIWFLILPLHAQYSEPIPMDPDLRYGILDNGLTYYIKHNDVVKDRADFYIVQNVGAILEEDNQDGLAHFLEHMAFNGTKNFPGKDLINYLETIGVKFGNNINAYTSLDETVYNLTSVPTYRKGIVDTALLILHDWSGFISLEDEEIDKERGVIREEWRTRANADRRLWTRSLPLLYENSQYAKRDIIGDTAVINNFEYKTLRDFYHKWYRPDLQAIIVVGDVNTDYVEQIIKTLFADIPKRENPDPRPIYPLQDNEEPIVVILTDPEAKITRIRIDYRHSPLSDRMKASLPGYITMLGNSLIINMINARLNEIAQHPDASFAAGFSAYQELVKSKDAFILMALPHEGKEKEALQTLLEEAEKIKRYGFTQTELDRAKADLLSSYEKAYNERNKTKNDSYVGEYIGNYLDFEPIPGIEWEYKTVQEVVPWMPLKEINVLAGKFTGEKNQTVLITGPDKNSLNFPTKENVLMAVERVKKAEIAPYEDKVPDKPLVANIPKKGKIKSEKKNNDLGVTEWILSNGVKVILKETDFKQDEILLYAYREGGMSTVNSIEDLPSGALSASIVMNNGVGEFSQIELNKLMAGKIATVTPSIAGYEENFSGNSSVKDFETLMQLVYLYFSSVRKDDNAYSSLINQYRTLLANSSLDPNNAFRDSIQVTITNHNPRTRPFDMQQLEKVNQEKALNIFKDRFNNPGNFTFFLIGNIDVEQLKPLVLTYLGSIPQKGKKEKWIDRGIRKPEGIVKNIFSKELAVDKASNYIVYSGHMKYNLANRLTAGIIRDILNIRFFESLREEEGGTYGVRVQTGISKIPLNELSLQMSFDTDPELQGKLLGLIHGEIEKIILHGPKNEDLQKVKENMRNNFNENQRENRWWLNAMISYYKDAENIPGEYLRILDEITGETVKNTLKQLIDQQNIIEVIMFPTKAEFNGQ
jgi:zinc protease